MCTPARRLPEIIIPRTHQLGDYASVVSRLIAIFARVAEVGEATLYNDLITADRDAIRVRALSDVAGGDGTVDLGSGVKMVSRPRGISVLAIARSLHDGWRPLLPP